MTKISLLYDLDITEQEGWVKEKIVCTILTATTVLYMCPDILGLNYAPFKAVLTEGLGGQRVIF